MKTLLCFFVLYFVFSVFAHNNKHELPLNPLDRGYALRFDGSDDYIDIPHLTFGNRFSIDFYARWRGVGGTILHFLSHKDEHEVLITLGSSGLVVRGCQGKTTCSTIRSTAVPQNQWHYFAIIRDSNGNSDIITKDSSTGQAYSILTGSNRLNHVNLLERKNNAIGRSLTEGNRFFNGDIDNVRIWNRLLSFSELSQNPLTIPTTKSNGAIAAWRFDEGSGNTAFDSSGNNRRGSLGGGRTNFQPTWIVSGNPTRTCHIWGSSQIKTFDSFTYCLRKRFTVAVGDFILAKTTSFEIQGRFAPRSNKPWLSGVAFKVGSNIMVFDLDFQTKFVPVVKLNGNTVTSNRLDSPFTYVVSQDRNTYKFSVSVPNLFDFEIVSYPKQRKSTISLNIGASLGPFTEGGLCGDLNLNAGNDPVVISNQAASPSLFITPTPGFVPVDSTSCQITELPVDSTLRIQANQVCVNSGFVRTDLQEICLEDICISGEISAGIDTAIVTYEDCVADIQASGSSQTCPIPCPGFCNLQGTCSSNGQCQCNPGWYGNDCSQQDRFPCYQAQWGSQTHTLEPFSEFGKTVAQHYSYNTIYGSSAATGNEVSEASVLYLYSDRTTSQEKVSLVVINDKPRDSTGGRARLNLQLNNGNNMNGMSLMVRDDPNDRYSISSTSITADWNWFRCCTDGLAFGPLPTGSFCINTHFQILNGIDRFFLSSENNFGSQDLFGVDMVNGLPPSDLKICGTQCVNPCIQYTNCGSCLNDPQCGWCPETATCQYGSPQGPASGFCSSWRWSVDPTESRVSSRELSYPVDPSIMEAYVAPNDDLEANFFVNIPAANERLVEVLYLQEFTTAFSSNLVSLSISIGNFYTNVFSMFSSARIGLAGFTDFPTSSSNQNGDYPYRTLLPLSRSKQDLQTIFAQSTVRNGGDSLQSQLTALLEMATSRSFEVGWSSNSLRVVVMVTKNLFHEGGNYPTRAQVKEALINANIVPVFIVLNSNSIVSAYRNLVRDFGFGYVSTFSNSNIPSIFPEAVRLIELASSSPQAMIINNGMISSLRPSSGYVGLSPLTRASFQVKLSTSAGSGDSLIFVPGFGTVQIKITGAECIQPGNIAPVLTSMGQQITQIVTLAGTSPYGDEVSIVTRLPLFGSLFQFNGGNLGNPINSSGTVITDPMFRAFYTVPNLIQDIVQYKIRADCGCESGPLDYFTLAPSTLSTTQAQQTTEARTTARQTTGIFTTAEQTTAEQTTAQQTTALRTTAEQTTALRTTAEQTTALRTTAQQTTAQQTTAQQTTAQQTTALRTTAEQTTALRTTAEQTTIWLSTSLQTTAQQTTAEQTTAERTTAEQTTAERTTAEQTTAERTTAERTTAEQTTAERTTAERTTAERTTAEQTTAERTTAERTTAEQTTAERTTFERTTAERTTAELTTGEQTTGEQTTGERTTAERTTGQQTTAPAVQVTTAQRTTGEITTGMLSCDGLAPEISINNNVFVEDQSETVQLFASASPSNGGSASLFIRSTPSNGIRIYQVNTNGEKGTQILVSFSQDPIPVTNPEGYLFIELNPNFCVQTGPTAPPPPAIIVSALDACGRESFLEVSLLVDCVNDPPFANPETFYIFQYWSGVGDYAEENIVLNVGDVDTNLNSLIITVVDLPTNGNVSSSTGTLLTPPNLSVVGAGLRYRHRALFEPITDSFSATISDGEFTIGPFRFDIVVNFTTNMFILIAPNPSTYTIQEGQNQVVFSPEVFLTLNVTDPDPDLTKTGPTSYPLFEFSSLPTHGGLLAFDPFTFGENEFTQLSNRISGQDLSGTYPQNNPSESKGDFFYRSRDPNFYGTDSFQWTAIDNRGKRWPFPATVRIFVTPVNDPPEILRAAGDVIFISSGATQVTVTDLLIRDDAYLSNGVYISHNLDVTVTISGTNGGIVTVPALTLSGPSVVFNISLGVLPSVLTQGIQYSSPTLVSDTLIVSVNDNGNVGVGGPLTSERSFTFSEGQALIGGSGIVTGAMIGATTLFGVIGGAIYGYMKKKKIILAEETDPWANDQMFENQLDNPVYSSNPSNLQVPPE